MANLRRTMQGFKDFAEKQINKKKKKKAAMEAEKIKIQDEKDMLDVQGAKDGGRMGYKNGSKCKLAMKGKGKAYGKNS
jgi:hypothetical protein